MREQPRWSPDGSRLAFEGFLEGGAGGAVTSSYTWNVFDGEEPREVESDFLGTSVTDWTPEGDRLITNVTRDLTGNFDIVIMNPDGSDATPYLQAPWAEGGGVVTPDGEWLAYGSDETGDLRLLLRSFPAPGETLTLATDGAGSHIWGPDGRTLYYPTSDSVKAVELEFEPEPRVVSRRALFSLRRPEGLLTSAFSFHPERGFVMVLNDEADADGTGPAPPRAYLVVNWFRELRQRMGN